MPAAPRPQIRPVGDPPRLGISTCLLGEPVRWDATDKLDRFLADTVGRHVEWVAVCPEVALGLGVPREPIRLVGEAQAPRLVGVHSGRNLTAAMRRQARAQIERLAEAGLSGYVLKSRSPSCGLVDVPVHAARGDAPLQAGRGLFADTLVRRLPQLPVEEERGLAEPDRRHDFFARVFTRHRWHRLQSENPTPQALAEFHRAHELIFHAHSPERHRELERVITAHATTDADGRLERYGRLLADALAVPATRERHAAVLGHLLAALDRALDAAARARLLDAVQSYRTGDVPLEVPLALVREASRHVGAPHWLRLHRYLDPYPAELRVDLEETTAG